MTDSKSHVPADDSLAVAGIVHDINQMLAVVTGRAGLLLTQAADPAWEPHLQAILLASADAAEMLRRLSAPGDGRTVEVGVDLREVTEEACSLVWPVSDARYEWVNEVTPGLGTTAPAQVLREVLVNLLLNALAVMPTGGQVVLRAARGDDGRVQLRLADSGPGLPVGDPEHLFARGVTASGKPDRGIGLAGCRQLLAGVGGGLTAEPGAAGAGAVFLFDLPGGGISAERVSDEAGDVPPIGVLVVDDEAVVRDMLHDVLAVWGCQAQVFPDGQGALEGYSPGTAVVALLDRNLPGLSGLELATRLRVSDPCLSIVLMTGWCRDEDLVPADPAVVDQTAEKPLAVDRIREILLAGHQLNESRRGRVPGA